MGELDMLDANLLTVEDVPALQELLAADETSLDQARASYDAYLSRVDLADRRRRLADDPQYAHFCGNA